MHCVNGSTECIAIDDTSRHWRWRRATNNDASQLGMYMCSSCCGSCCVQRYSLRCQQRQHLQVCKRCQITSPPTSDLPFNSIARYMYYNLNVSCETGIQLKKVKLLNNFYLIVMVIILEQWFRTFLKTMPPEMWNDYNTVRVDTKNRQLNNYNECLVK